MTKVLITGGNGRVGRRLTERFSSRGLEVRVVDIAAGDDSAVEYFAGDIGDADLMSDAVSEVDYVLHLAAIPVENGRARDLFRVNVEGTFNVVHSAAEAGVKGVVFASTVAVYGMLHPSKPYEPRYFPIDEDLPVVPERNYATSKIIGEHYLEAFTRSHGMDGVVLRLATVMNPGAENWRSIAANIDNPEQVFIRDRSIREYLWQYVHVYDAVQAFDLAVQHLQRNPGMGFDVFNIGAAENASSVPSLELISRYFPDTPIVKDPRAFAELPTAALYGIDKARRVLGFEPAHSWRDV